MVELHHTTGTNHPPQRGIPVNTHLISTVTTVSPVPEGESLPKRNLTVICGIGKHRYCSQDILDRGCDCSCHFTEEFRNDFNSFAFSLWHIGRATRFMEDEERDAHILILIKAAHGTVDLDGLSAEDYLARIKPTVNRDYWSARETDEDFAR